MDGLRREKIVISRADLKLPSRRAPFDRVFIPRRPSVTGIPAELATIVL